MTESHEARLKRLHMRSMRRGIREMDLILSSYASAKLPAMDAPQLELYDLLLSESDHDLYNWVTGQETPPDDLQEMIADIAQTFKK